MRQKKLYYSVNSPNILFCLMQFNGDISVFDSMLFNSFFLLCGSASACPFRARPIFGRIDQHNMYEHSPYSHQYFIIIEWGLPWTAAKVSIELTERNHTLITQMLMDGAAFC